MTDFVYPRGSHDDSELLLQLLGSYWHNVYEGADQVQSLAYSRAQRDIQTHLDLLELIAAISRTTTPIFHRENWYLLTIKESEINTDEQLMATYEQDSTRQYSEGTDLEYGVVPGSQAAYSVAIPDELVNCPLIFNRVTAPSLTWTKGIDYWIPKAGLLTFRENPFDNSLVAVREIFVNNEVTDREAALWIFRGEFDWDMLYQQFGYALKMRLQSSDGYRQLINAVLDALTQGTTKRSLQYAWSAITGIPLVWEDEETVEAIRTDRRGLVVVTDQHIYRFPSGSRTLVSEGDVVYGGDSLVDTLQFFEFNRGVVPADLIGLAMGRGFLTAGYYGDITFENTETPLIVEPDVDGFTKVSFDLGGFPADVEYFWEQVHTRGIAAGQTLAHLLDVRDNPIGEPLAASLPATINPLEFLCQNLLRFNAFVVYIRAGVLGDDSLGLSAAAHLRRIIPPATAMLVVVELGITDEPVIMDGPGDDEHPGYEETVSGFPCMVISETLDGTTMITEDVQLKQLRGKCE